MKTELFRNIANEAIYQVQYYKNLYLTHKKVNKRLLLLFSITTVFLLQFTFINI